MFSDGYLSIPTAHRLGSQREHDPTVQEISDMNHSTVPTEDTNLDMLRLMDHHQAHHPKGMIVAEVYSMRTELNQSLDTDPLLDPLLLGE